MAAIIGVLWDYLFSFLAAAAAARPSRSFA